MKAYQVPPTYPKKRKPILYWIVTDLQGNEVARNNSIALLRWQWGKGYLFKAVR